MNRKLQSEILEDSNSIEKELPNYWSGNENPNKNKHENSETLIDKENEVDENEDNIDLKGEIMKLSSQLKSHENEIEQLKQRVKQLESEKEEKAAKETKTMSMTFDSNDHHGQSIPLEKDDTPEVKCTIVPSPPQVAELYQQILSDLKETFASEEMRLTEDAETGPSLVVAVNSSRIIADVKRDIGKKDLKEPVLLIIMKPSRNVDEKPNVQLIDLQDTRIKEFCFFLVDASFSKLHYCNVNLESFNIVYNFLKNC